MKAMGVELVHREHILGPEDMSRATLVDVIAERTALAIKSLALEGADFNDKLTVTIGAHPSFPGACTIEAKAAKRQTWQRVKGGAPAGLFVAPVGTPPPARLLDLGDITEPIDDDEQG